MEKDSKKIESIIEEEITVKIPAIEIEEEITVEISDNEIDEEVTMEISDTPEIKNSNYCIAEKSLLGKREEQQDYYLVYEKEEDLLLIVCDGIGGLTRGSEASKIAAETLKALYILKEGNTPDFFKNSANTVNEKVRILNDSESTKATAGTTLVAVAIENNKLFWWSIGDSRIYLFRDGEMIQVTQDDNYENKLNQMLKAKEISLQQYDEEMKKGAALISFLGKAELTSLNVSRIGFDVRMGDKILLTSDGLYKSMPSETFKQIIESASDVKEAADIIEEKVKDIAGDNTTFILAERIK